MRHSITDPTDPRLGDYRHLKDRPLRARDGKLMAEGELVVRRLLESGWPVLSLLTTEARLAALGEATAAAREIFVVSEEVMGQVAGFPFHRGVLAVGVRPPAPRLPAAARRVVVLEDLVDVDNLGAMVRNAAAFGVDAVLLSPRCADPYYRKAIRTAVGHCFRLPLVRASSWPEDFFALQHSHGMTLLGAALDAGAVPLPQLVPPPRFALALGAEGPGLSAALRAGCHTVTCIPMAAGVDSLNVAVAGAVALYHLSRQD